MQEAREINIKELTVKTIGALQTLGMEVHTAWNEYCGTYIQIERFFEKCGQQSFDRAVMDEFMRHIQRRLDAGEIGHRYYNRLKHAAERITEFHDTGRLEWSFRGKVSKFKLTAHYEKVLEQFLGANKDFHHNTRGDIIWVAKKYFAWLAENGCDDIRAAGAKEIQRFMIYCSKHLKSSSVHNIKIYMKKLCRYLVETGLASSNYEGLLSFPVCRGSRIFPVIPQKDIALMLDIIDRRVPKGKRDYAIIMLGVVTGLRAVDIAKLKLADIDWQKGEVKILQSKTDVALALPLTHDVGEALKDYILSGRPKTTSDSVFVRKNFPYQAFSNGDAIGDIHDYYLKRAGVPRIAFDGRGFHGLRRALSSGMTIAGVSVMTTAQVLGDRDMNSLKKYISLDSVHLKECALDFTGIELEGGLTK
jgi:integrase